MTIGNGAEQSRVSDLDEAKQILDIFQSYGHNEVDTSCYYGSGSSEEYLGKLNWQERGIISILPLGIPRITTSGHTDRNICGRTYSDH